MSLFAKSVFLLLLLTLLSSNNVLGKTQVRVTSKLEGELDQTVHSKSRDNDTKVQYPRRISIFPKTHVRVTNTLEGGLDLTVHCKSRNDDIGVQYLRPNAFFQFSFRANLFGSTLFFCGFRWKNAFHWFDIYVASRDEKRCDNCFWVVKKNGPCLFANDNSTDCYPWNNP
uniref:S-protein homolog n=1 Tax=Cajanus cajan TaxID=3821 RepID=A0A151TAZ7_CAJCA|nr:hypothetical protein KK1_018794 [Cajanus cajan]